MGKKAKKSVKTAIWLSLAIGVIFSYFVWTSWRLVTNYFGSTFMAWAISGGVVLLAIITGHFNIGRIAKKFS